MTVYLTIIIFKTSSYLPGRKGTRKGVKTSSETVGARESLGVGEREETVGARESLRVGEREETLGARESRGVREWVMCSGCFPFFLLRSSMLSKIGRAHV